MQEIYAQRKGDSLHPVSREYLDILRSYPERKMLRIEIYGTRKQRSVEQNAWIHSIFRIVADNSDDPDWDTPEKVKRNVKMAMRFFKDDVVVHNNKVYFELRSFAFDKMEHQEANVRYEEAKLICAKKLGVDPATLEAEAQRE